MQRSFELSDFLTDIKQATGIDAEHAIEAIGGSEILYEMMLMQFTRLLPAYIDEMDTSIRTDKWDIFAIRAHGIKGSMRQIGNLRLSKTGESLEKAAKENNLSYCRERYKDFRDELFSFHTQVSGVFERLGKNASTALKNKGDIKDYTDTLQCAKAALEDYDTLSAADILRPLIKIKFGDNTDSLLEKTAAALESFQPQKAHEYIADILSGGKI